MKIVIEKENGIDICGSDFLRAAKLEYEEYEGGYTYKHNMEDNLIWEYEFINPPSFLFAELSCTLYKINNIPVDKEGVRIRFVGGTYRTAVDHVKFLFRYMKADQNNKTIVYEYDMTEEEE